MFWEFHIAPTRHNDFLINMELVPCHKQPSSNIFAYGLHIVVNSHCQDWYTNSHHLLNMFCKLILKQVCKSTFRSPLQNNLSKSELRSIIGWYIQKQDWGMFFLLPISKFYICMHIPTIVETFHLLWARKIRPLHFVSKIWDKNEIHKFLCRLKAWPMIINHGTMKAMT